MEYTSKHSIGDDVKFKKSDYISVSCVKSEDIYYGHIVSIKFTKAKVFYDIVDDYYGHLHTDIDSVDVV